MTRGPVYWHDYAVLNEGMDCTCPEPCEAMQYAHRRAATDPGQPDTNQLEIPDPDRPPRGQIGPAEPWPEDFF
ncbi:MAG: hypothetical protein KJ058_00530 [Thermoanaerobaculia bacterium]|nr:hypothetical protein [Thermoanaerobaculia bacterium]